MTIQKNQFMGHLETPLVELSDVSVRLPGGVYLAAPLDRGNVVFSMLRTYPDKRGKPELATIEDGRCLSVFPRADKRYRLRVIGTQYVEQ